MQKLQTFVQSKAFIYLLTLAGWGLSVFLYSKGVGPAPPPTPPLPQQVATVDGGQVDPAGAVPPQQKPVGAMGWHNKPQEVAAVIATMVRPRFAMTPAGQAVDPLPKSAFLWQAYTQLFGRPPPEKNQGQVGDCVGFGSSRAYERSLGVQIVHGDRFEFKHLAEEVTYGVARVEIGRGQIPANQDGAVGAWAAKGFTQFGGLPRGVYGKADLTTYSESLAKQYGAKGCAPLEAEIKKYPAGDAAQVGSWADAKKALANGYGIAVCSNQGFAAQRNANGVCQAQGNWDHCMCLDGFYTDTDGREYGHIENSWGTSYHTGPVGWGDPNQAGFWAASAVIDGMLRQGDSWAISSVKGFPSNKINWFAGRPMPMNSPSLATRRSMPTLALDRFPDVALAY